MAALQQVNHKERKQCVVSRRNAPAIQNKGKEVTNPMPKDKERPYSKKEQEELKEVLRELVTEGVIKVK